MKAMTLSTIAMAAVLAGCFEKESKKTGAEEKTEANLAAETVAAAEVAAPAEEIETPAAPAVVFENDEEIVSAYGKTLTYGEAVDNIRRAMKMQGVPEEQLEQAVAQVAPMALPQMAEEFVMKAALENAAEKCGITCTAEEIDAKFEEVTAQRPQGMTLEQAFEQAGINADELKKQIGEMMPIQKLFEQLTEGEEVSDEEVAKYYEENGQVFETPEQVRASHILVKVDKGASDEDKAAAKSKIEGLLAQVKEGADFAELATANSDCPSKSQGGDLGMFGKGQMVKPFEDAVWALEDNAVSEIVETQFGYHIIKRTGYKEAGKTAFDEVKTDIKAYLERQKKDALLEKYVAGIRAGVEYKANEKLSPIFATEEESAEDDADESAEAAEAAETVDPEAEIREPPAALAPLAEAVQASRAAAQEAKEAQEAQE